MHWLSVCGYLTVLVVLTRPPPVKGQTTDTASQGLFPTHAFLVTGYGTAGWNGAFVQGPNSNSFTASLNPILLFQISDRTLFESEIEFGLSGSDLETDLEYADIGYVLTEHLVVTAGKFLLPFNIFTERLHPTWINKLSTPPPVYGHHGATGGPTMPMLPILSDLGAQFRAHVDVGTASYLTAAAFVSQGPRMEEEHTGLPPEEETAEVPEISFGENFTDNNGNKLLGGRVGYGVASYFEVNLSGMTATYDSTGSLRFTGVGAHLEGRYQRLEFHGEWMRTSQELPLEDFGGEHLVRNGYFLQLSHRRGKVEPVIRWTQLFAADVGSETVVPAGRQLAFGIDLWAQPALVVKANYAHNFRPAGAPDDDRLSVQWAFGF